MVLESAENYIAVRNVFFERSFKNVGRCKKGGGKLELNYGGNTELKRLQNTAQLKGIVRVSGERFFALSVPRGNEPVRADDRRLGGKEAALVLRVILKNGLFADEVR